MTCCLFYCTTRVDARSFPWGYLYESHILLRMHRSWVQIHCSALLRKVSLTCSPGRPKPCEGIWVVSWVADETQDWAIVWPPHELWALCQTAHSMWNLQIQVRRTKWQFWEFQTIDTIPLTIRVNIRTDFIPPAIDNKANVATLFRRFQQNVNLLRHVTKKNHDCCLSVQNQYMVILLF
jgi:hypothetical protein